MIALLRHFVQTARTVRDVNCVSAGECDARRADVITV